MNRVVNLSQPQSPQPLKWGFCDLLIRSLISIVKTRLKSCPLASILKGVCWFLFWKSCIWYQMRLIMISATQAGNQKTWFQRIMQEGCSSRICKRFSLFITGLIILIFGIAVVAFHLSHTTFYQWLFLVLLFSSFVDWRPFMKDAS